MIMNPVIAADPDRAGRVLSEAVRRIASAWNLSNAKLGAILGLSAPTVWRMKGETYQLTAGSKSFELAQLLLRLFRSLDSFAGGDDRVSRAWLTNDNSDLGAKPVAMLDSIPGLMEVCHYVDGIRART